MPTTLELPLGSRNAFDRLLNWISILRVQGQDVTDFERDVLDLERMIQSFDIEPLTRTVNSKLDYWLDLILQPSNAEKERVVQQSLTVVDIQKKIRKILITLKQSEQGTTSFAEAIKLISDIEPIEDFKISSEDFKISAVDLSKEWIKKALERITGEERFSIEVTPENHIDRLDRKKCQNYQCQWEIFIKFSGDHHRASKVSKLLWLLSEVLESVSGVVVEIEDQGTGSIWFKLKVFTLNLVGKDEVRDLLEKSRDAVLAEQVDKRIEGAEKLKEERLKIQVERSLLERQTELTPDSEEARKIRELELKRKELEIREKEADVKRKELENYKATLDLTQQLAYLMKEGMFAAAPVEIKINGETYLSCQDGKFLGGATMEVIDQAGAVKSEEDELP